MLNQYQYYFDLPKIGLVGLIQQKIKLPLSYIYHILYYIYIIYVIYYVYILCSYICCTKEATEMAAKCLQSKFVFKVIFNIKIKHTHWQRKQHRKKYMHLCMDGWMNGWTDGPTDEWTDRQTDGWMDGWIYSTVAILNKKMHRFQTVLQ